MGMDGLLDGIAGVRRLVPVECEGEGLIEGVVLDDGWRVLRLWESRITC